MSYLSQKPGSDFRSSDMNFMNFMQFFKFCVLAQTVLAVYIDTFKVEELHKIESLANENGDNSLTGNQIPSKEEGAVVARTLVNRESMMSMNTISQSGTDKGLPKSSMEYYVDCDGDGDPYWLVVDIGSPFRHISEGSSFSVSIRVGDHPQNDYVNPEYPGGIVLSPMGSPRVNLMGEFQDVAKDPKLLLKLRECFLERHPDSKWWLPTNVVLPHKTHWVKIIVKDVYMVGGFGDRAYIGSIDDETYHKAEILS